MIPENKAKELVDRFIEMNHQHQKDTKEQYGNSLQYHKQCALIAVDEVILSLPRFMPVPYDESLSYVKKYLEEVKEEIKKID